MLPDLVEHFHGIVERMQAEYRLSALYKHRGGRGDLREAIVGRWLHEVLPSAVGATKGEIVDSTGRRSSEFDFIIYSRSPTVRMFSAPEARSVPIEEVLGTLEVRTHLEHDTIAEVCDKLAAIGSFERFYRPTGMQATISHIIGDDNSDLVLPFGACESRRSIGRVLGGLFAFEGPSDATIEDYLSERPGCDRFLFVYVLGRGIWCAGESCFTGCQGAAESLVLLNSLIAKIADDQQRWSHVAPDSERYVDLAVKAVVNRAGR